ncbi:MAG: hypothetical protein QOJ99_3479 [Bryobacterales bacterium]|nr:hypothetical protein [Bryobacterales bacterium]
MLLSRLIVLGFAAVAAFAQPQCAGCHAEIYRKYQQTGMGRSFSRPQAFPAVKDFYNAASETHYSMFERGGRYYQRRWQIGYAGNEENAEEMTVDFVMGSGNHARTYLHRTERGTLTQLPLGWYAEKGGYWDMNPGYDVAHPPVRRPIADECLFCHNAYPVAASTLPEGIDCQRCHGPGAKHIQSPQKVNIINPARLSKDRQLEACMQCHLETTSTRLPGLLRRFDRGAFSYVPDQPLGDFVMSFDHAPGSGREDKFEIAGSAYRLRQSQCFLKSRGEMTCTTCHNPHEAKVSLGACVQCHTSLSSGHPAGDDCASCHMPKRNTDDVVHVAMTDHLIARRPAARKSRPEIDQRYRGEVVPYYPSAIDPLYKAVAQVIQGSNPAGIPQLTAELAKRKPTDPEFYIVLGQASKSVAAYEQAVRLKPDAARNLRYLGVALKEAGQPVRAGEALRRAVQLAPTDAQGWFELGLLQSAEGRKNEAISSVRRAIALNPDLADAQNSLGVNLFETGDVKGAEAAFRAALTIDPSYAVAHSGLARVLTQAGDLPQALFHYEKAVRLQPGYAPYLYEYALTFVRLNRFEESDEQVRAAIRADGNLAEAHELLGGLLARKKDMDGALAEFEAAVRLKPDFSRAQLDLGATLAGRGDMTGAILHLREAARGSDPQVAQQAARALQQIGAN